MSPDLALLCDVQRTLKLQQIKLGEEELDETEKVRCRVIDRMRDLALQSAVAAALVASPAAAQAQHLHPTGTIPTVTGEFYETWMRPDMPQDSCCSKQDCDVAEVRTRDGKTEARHIGGEWHVIPQQKIEQNRDSPDGQNHLCVVGTTVLCFIFGNGT